MLNGRTAIITGGVRGIGKGIACEFAKNGANLTLCYRASDEAAAKTKEELEALGARVLLMKGDVADYEFAALAAARTKEEFGTVDILVNNAGITRDRLLLRMTAEDFSAVVNTNLCGSFNFLKAVSDIMMQQKYGRIINLSSIVGIHGNPGQINYCASKAGIIGMTRAAARELGRRGITVNAIAPGYIATDMTAVLSEERKNKVLEGVAIGRAGTPEDIAKTALFLASEGAGYVSGQVIEVTGAMRA